MRILFITDYLPYPLICGDRIRVYNLIRQMTQHHEVSLVGFLQTSDEEDGVSHMREFCSDVVTVNLPQRHKLARIPRISRYVLAGIPFDFEFLYSGELADKTRELVSDYDPHIVHIEQSRMAPYRETLPARARFRSILGLQNVAAVQFGRIAQVALTPTKRLRSRLNGQMLRRWEPRVAERFDRCLAVSGVDQQLLVSANPRLQVEIIPNGVDCERYQPLLMEDVRPALLLIGNMSYPPCADGAIWFCEEILPLIRKKLGQVAVWIAGISPPPQVERLSGDGVHVTGRVEDIVSLYRRSAVSIVPLRAGSGTRLKILEAMALGRPVVSTSIGCEGLDVEIGRHLLVADDPEQFSINTVRLLTDRRLYHQIVGDARHLVMTKYDWKEIAKQLLRVYATTVQEARDQSVSA